MTHREETDSMGTVVVPRDAYYGAQTQRAVDNFPKTGLTLPIPFMRALALIKKCAASANRELGLLSPTTADAVIRAADEAGNGDFDDQFIVDVFQTGSGTSTHMNINEVLATRANELLTGVKKTKNPVHPNDHVNLGQSSNDVVPSAIHIAALCEIRRRLLPALEYLKTALSEKAEEFRSIKKIGRTHLQDALPISWGQVFSGYARQVELGITRISGTEKHLAELALGGTAVGTGVNTHPLFAGKVIERLCTHTGLPFIEASNHFEAQSSRDAALEVSGALKTAAVSLVKIANDLRLSASGPRCGIGELTLPALQPGSSIMPGKINPVIPESVIQIAYQVMGSDTVIMMSAQGGLFELNANLPVIAHNLLQSIGLLTSGAEVFAEKCIRGVAVNEQKCRQDVEKSLALATMLVPHIGYDRAAEIARKAFETGKTIRETMLEEAVLPEELLNQLF